MSQNIFSTINPATTSGTQLATILNDFKNAVVSGFSGVSRPAELQAGGYWIDTATANTYLFKIYDGTSDITMFSLNLTTGAASISGVDSTFSISKTSADVVGPILDFLKSRIASGGQVVDGDTVMELRARSKTDAGSTVTVGRIRCIADDSHTASALGSYWSIEGVAEGTSTLSEMIALRRDKIQLLTTASLSTVEYNKLDVVTVTQINPLATTHTLVRLTGSTACLIQGINGAGKAKHIIIHNASSADTTLAHQDAAANVTDRIILPNALSLTVKPNSAVELFYDTTDTRWRLKSAGSSGSGGGGGAGGGANWQGVAGLNPIESIEYDEKVWQFEALAGQALTLWVKVPSSYQAGSPINFRGSFYSPGATGNYKFQTITTLVRAGTDAITSTTNQKTVDTGDLVSDLADKVRSATLALSESNGVINSVAVSANDIIKIQLSRIAATGTEDSNDVRFIPGSTEVTFAN